MELMVDLSRENENILEDVERAIKQLFTASEEQFEEIKKEKWFHRLWKMVTLSNKKEIQMAEQISTLAQAQEGLVKILVILSAHNQEISDLVRDNMEFIKKLQTNNKDLLNRSTDLENKVYGFTKGYNISKLSRVEKATLNSCIYYLSQQFEPPSDNQRDYDRGIQRLLNNEDTRTDGVDLTKDFLTKELPKIRDNDVKKCILRCCLEYIYLHRLDKNDFEGAICKSMIDMFDVGSQTVSNAERLVVETVNRFGKEQLIENYKSNSISNTFTMEFDLEPEVDELPESSESETTSELTQPHEFLKIEAYIKDFTQRPEFPLGKPQKVTENLIIKLFSSSNSRPVFKTVKAITKTSKAFMVFTTYAMYYIAGKEISQIPYAQASSKDIIISSENGIPVLCYEQFRLLGAGFDVEILKEFLVKASETKIKPSSDRATSFDSLSLETRIGYFRIVAILVSKAGYPLHEVYRFSDVNNLSAQWQTISANLQFASPDEEIRIWKDHVCYPNEELLYESLLKNVCLMQIRTSGKNGLSHEDERYYELILSDKRKVSEKKFAVITGVAENDSCMDGSDNGPVWKRYKEIKTRISSYEHAIDVAKQAGEADILKGLENALDQLKKRSCFSTLSADSQELLLARIREFLVAEKVNAKLIEDLTPKEQVKMLTQMSPTDATISIDNVIGIYNPSIGDIITNSFSGILFTKDACYIDWRIPKPICLPYTLIDSATHPNTGQGLKMVFTIKGKGDKKHSKIILDGLMMSTEEIKTLFADIIKIYSKNAS